jgi:hypothetical protein
MSGSERGTQVSLFKAESYHLTKHATYEGILKNVTNYVYLTGNTSSVYPRGFPMSTLKGALYSTVQWAVNFKSYLFIVFCFHIAGCQRHRKFRKQIGKMPASVVQYPSANLEVITFHNKEKKIHKSYLVNHVTLSTIEVLYIM